MKTGRQKRPPNFGHKQLFSWGLLLGFVIKINSLLSIFCAIYCKNATYSSVSFSLHIYVINPHYLAQQIRSGFLNHCEYMFLLLDATLWSSI